MIVNNESYSHTAKNTEEGQSNTQKMEGLQPPRLEESGDIVHGEPKALMQKESKRQKQKFKELQTTMTQWKTHKGKGDMNTPPPTKPTATFQNLMCPTGQALTHPAVGVLQEWATFVCPTQMGNSWTKEEIWEVLKRGPHQSALMPEAIAHFAEVAAEKVRTYQARIVAWEDIKDNPPRELKISPITVIPHKSKAFLSILDLSFRLKLKNGGGASVSQ
jgi:hypothetical protein